ncbi:hypothetical protein GKE82_00010 [Conexibacter sp. W3-3-2]|nr:hypothetical protein [Conexibacter sp. W3-3-2]
MIAEMCVKTDAASHAARGLAEGPGAAPTRRRRRSPSSSPPRPRSGARTRLSGPRGAGYVDDHPVERYFRDSRVTTLYEGTSQIQKLIIGRAETGHQRPGAVVSAFAPIGVVGAGTMGAGIARPPPATASRRSCRPDSGGARAGPRADREERRAVRREGPHRRHRGRRDRRPRHGRRRDRRARPCR